MQPGRCQRTNIENTFEFCWPLGFNQLKELRSGCRLRHFRRQKVGNNRLFAICFGIRLAQQCDWSAEKLSDKFWECYGKATSKFQTALATIQRRSNCFELDREIPLKFRDRRHHFRFNHLQNSESFRYSKWQLFLHRKIRKSSDRHFFALQPGPSLPNTQFS